MDHEAVTVLVAEDEALIRMDLVEMLGELGYRVVAEAADGQSAVDLARALRPGIVFLDIAMPIRDGLSAAEEIAGEGIAPVVMVTAFSQREAVERARTAGVMGYLVKPFTKSDVTPAIELAVARWGEMQDLASQVEDLAARNSAQAAVTRAKALLQAADNLTEAEAFAALRRRAMDARVTLAEAAVGYLENSATDGANMRPIDDQS
jgi:response regulator NasT